MIPFQYVTVTTFDDDGKCHSVTTAEDLNHGTVTVLTTCKFKSIQKVSHTAMSKIRRHRQAHRGDKR